MHSTKQKIYNWQTLNEKVFKKIEIPLSKKTIDSLANAEQGVIEKVLKKLYLKVKNDECSLQKIDLMNSQKLKKENKEIDYKNVIYNKELEIIQLKKKLKELQKEVAVRQQENAGIKDEITQYQKRIDIEKNSINI